MTVKYQNTAAQIIKMAAEANGITVKQMESASRLRQFAHPRQEAMAALVRSGRYSTPAIGRMFDRDHTTVLHANKAVKKRQAASKIVDARVNDLICAAKVQQVLFKSSRAAAVFRRHDNG